MVRQFAVVRNKNAKTKRAIPYLLNVQHDILGDLQTRVVVPLYVESAFGGQTMTRVTPTFEVDGKRVVMVTPQLAGISVREIGRVVADFSTHRAEILDALDFLWTAI
jgi:toxin CcdB